MPSIASGRPTIPLETLTTRPQPRSSMSGTTARARLIGANTLIANADCSSPGSVLSVGPTGQTTAALLIRMSTPPSSPTTAAIACGTWSGSPRSAGATFATRPRARTSSAVSSSSSCERASSETFAPAWARASAVARPMPLPAPVTSAWVPSNASSAVGVVIRLPFEGEVRLWALKQLAVEEDVDLLVVEGDQAGDRQDRRGGKVIRPGHIRLNLLVCDERPVAGRLALVRAARDRRRGLQVLEANVGAVEVVAGRQACLEHHHRRRRLGEHDPVE